MGQQRKRLLIATGNMEIFVGKKNVVFCSSYNAPTCFRNLHTKSFTCSERGMALSKHVTCYGPRSGFLYYNMTTPLPKRGLPYRPPRDSPISYGFERHGLYKIYSFVLLTCTCDKLVSLLSYFNFIQPLDL